MPDEKESETKVEEKNLNVRFAEFNKKLGELLIEYKLGISASAFILPDGRIAAKPNVFDDSKRQKEDASGEADRGANTKEKIVAQ